tara:strand:- start:5623 stop:5784 length:162 start_codon:yes stop_codon:yes gene_type:complete
VVHDSKFDKHIVCCLLNEHDDFTLRDISDDLEDVYCFGKVKASTNNTNEEIAR